MAHGAGIQRPRSLVHALASRERSGRASYSDILTILPRRRWTIDQVLSLEDCAVLLGFSSDGNHLLYYSLWETSYVVFWKRIGSTCTSQRLELSLALRLQVGKQLPMTRSFDGPNVGSRLRVWQSSDDQLVCVVAMDNNIASQDSGPSYHFTLSPSPSYCSRTGCTRSVSLSFSYTLPSPTQDVEAWQLLSRGNDRYLVVLNMGSSVVVLALSLAQGSSEAGQAQYPRVPRVNFNQRPWYSPPEFPIEFSYQEFSEGSSGTSTNARLECVCQHEFDCEAFLASFFRKYAVFRNLHLVDYDLRLARANQRDSTLFMTCVADLESSPSISSQRIDQSRLALFLALEIYTGEYHIMRALKMPRQQPLRQMSTVLTRKFLGNLKERHPLDPTSTEWNNDPVMSGRSLDAVHNPRFPISVYFK